MQKMSAERVFIRYSKDTGHEGLEAYVEVL